MRPLIKDGGSIPSRGAKREVSRARAKDGFMGGGG